MFTPQGVFVAMMTPFSQEGCLDEGTLRKLVDFLVEKGVHGLFPASSVGESPLLTLEERVRLMEIVTEQANGRVPVTPGVGSTHPAHSIHLAKEAKRVGCQAVVVAPPYFYKVSEEMMERYFHAIADASELPLIIYNIPVFTQPMSPRLVGSLSLRENVVGIKDSSGSMVEFVHFMDEVARVGGELSFMIGREDMLFPALVMGARGCMVATACALPEAVVAIYKAWEVNDWERARRIQMAIVPFIRACFSLPFPAGFKLAMECRGFPMGPSRQPLSSAEEKRREVLRGELQRLTRSILDAL